LRLLAISCVHKLEFEQTENSDCEISDMGDKDGDDNAFDDVE
jgi:hypothetical protein